MKKIVCIVIVLISLCSCNQNQNSTYTVTAGSEYRTVIGYGTVVCDDVVSVNIPSKSQNIELKVTAGDKIQSGDILADYTKNGSELHIQAKSNGIIISADSKSISYYDMSKVKIIAKVGESDVSVLSKDMQVNITGVGFKKDKYTGKIKRISSIADKTLSGTFIDCEISVDDSDLSLVPSFTARVEITVPIDNQVLVPLESLQYDGEFYVYKLVDNEYQRIKVSSSTVCGELCAVSGEIKAGDIIAINTGE